MGKDWRLWVGILLVIIGFSGAGSLSDPYAFADPFEQMGAGLGVLLFSGAGALLIFRSIRAAKK